MTAPALPDARAWRDFLERLCAYGGALACAAAIVFLVAFNWQAWPPAAKFALLQGALAAAAAAAWRLGTARAAGRVVLLFAMILCGALLAYLGQRYQTGADSYQLFLAWGLLILPWVAASRSVAGWALLLVLANLAAQLYAGRFSPFLLEALGAGGPHPALFWLDLSAAAAAEWLGARLADGGRMRFLPRLAGALVLAVIVASLSGAIFGGGAGAAFWAMRAAMILALAGAFAFYRWRRDLPMLTLCCMAAIAVATAGFVRLLAEGDPGEFALLVIGVFLIAASAGAAVWLRGQQARWAEKAAPAGEPVRPPAGQPPAGRDAPSPWHVRLMLGVCGWLGGLLLLVFIGLVVPDPFGARSLALAGVLLLAAARIALRGRPPELRAQFALSLCLAGYGALAVACSHWLPDWGALLAASALGLLLTAAMPSEIARTFGIVAAVLAAEGCLRVLEWPSPVPVIAAWTCAAVWLHEARLARRPGSRLAPLAWGVTLALWALGLAGALWPETALSLPPAGRGLAWAAHALAALALAWTAWRLSARAGPAPRAWATGTAFAIAAAGAWIPGVAFGLMTAVLGHARARAPLWAGGLLVALWSVGWFYYAQSWTLPHKAAMLLALGSVLLLARRGIVRLGARETGHD